MRLGGDHLAIVHGTRKTLPGINVTGAPFAHQSALRVDLDDQVEAIRGDQEIPVRGGTDVVTVVKEGNRYAILEVEAGQTVDQHFRGSTSVEVIALDGAGLEKH